jgi:hypothetical protein
MFMAATAAVVMVPGVPMVLRLLHHSFGPLDRIAMATPVVPMLVAFSLAEEGRPNQRRHGNKE